MLDGMDKVSRFFGLLLSILWRAICLGAILGYIENQTQWGTKAVEWCKEKFESRKKADVK